MIKDRLPELKAAIGSDVDEGEVQIELDTSPYMDEFFNQIDDIQTNLQRIQACVSEVKKYHSLILAAPTADDKMKEELEKHMFEIKKTAQVVRAKLKEMGISIQNLESQIPNAEIRIKKAQYAFLSYLLTECMTSYNVVQIEHRENLKKRIARQLDITGKTTDDEEIERMLESGNAQIFTEGVLMETKIAKQTLADIEARHQDILKLEASIKELHDMFLDMAMLVESQGKVIDSIEYNIQQSVDYIFEAKQDTKKAQEYQTAARKKKLIIIAIVVIIIVIIIIILIVVLSKYIPSSNNNNNNNNNPTKTNRKK